MILEESPMARIIRKLYDIEYNGTKAGALGGYALERPDIPSPVKNVTTYAVPGRDGVLTQWDGSYAPITIELRIGFHAKENQWMETCREIRAWLLSDGDRILRLGDDSGCFYRVSDVTVGTAVRTARLVGEMPVSFLCDPYTYLDSGLLEHAVMDVMSNPYETCHPVIKVKTMSASDFFIGVNGNYMRFQGIPEIVIDTERMISYAPDGTPLNSAVIGDYEKLYLKPGENQFHTYWKHEYKVIPNWRRL